MRGLVPVESLVRFARSPQEKREIAMLRERWIAMEAVDRRANVFRAWRCEIGTDLLGSVVVSVTFGRTGTAGRTITRAVGGEAAARKLLRQLLARRATAERRIGVGYRVIGGEGLSDLGSRRSLDRQSGPSFPRAVAMGIPHSAGSPPRRD